LLRSGPAMADEGGRATDYAIEVVKRARYGASGLVGYLDPQIEPAQLASDLKPLLQGSALLFSLTSGPAFPSGTSVGIDLRANDGRWWHVDATVTTGVGRHLTDVRVTARPPAFTGRSGGLIVCVFGPSSSGKSSLMEALAEHSGTPWTRFDEMALGKVPIQYLIWPGAAGPMREGFLAGVAAFARVGNQVALSAPPDPDVRAAFVGIATVFVHLVAPLGVLVARQGSRRDRWAGLAEETHAADKALEGWDLEIDTSECVPIQAAQRLIAYLQDRGLGGLVEPDLAHAPRI
jgi:chloramphenicol 3-O-phosphotransferase